MQGPINLQWKLSSCIALVVLARVAIADDGILRIVEEDEEVMN